MRVAFVGKGGSGKTSLSTLFARTAAERGIFVVFIDADINQFASESLGITVRPRAQSLADASAELKTFYRGTNPRIHSDAQVLKTTPAGNGSGIVRLGESNPVFERCGTLERGIWFLSAGSLTESDIGMSCYHAKIGAVEMLLNHFEDRADELVIVDMTAGADCFSSALFAQFDQTFLVVEPTAKGIQVFEQYVHAADPFQISIHVLANKITSELDRERVQRAVGDRFLDLVPFTDFFWKQDREGIQDLSHVPESLVRVIDHGLKKIQDASHRELWLCRRQELVNMLHVRIGMQWADERFGFRAQDQVDPDFILGIGKIPRESSGDGQSAARA